jgi:hypothetical protein
MSKLLKDMPGWGQFILALGTLLVAGTWAFANVKEEISLLRQKDTFIETNILEIKQLLRDEMEQHHPRKP